MLAMRNAYFLAQSLLTRLPTPHLEDIQASDSGRSALFYPLVGLLIGVIIYIPIVFFSSSSPILLATIITVLWVIITGGLHLDGLADSADGWLGGMGDKEKTLMIMKDPRVGSAGVIAIVCLLLLKFSVLMAILQQTFHQIVSSSVIIIIAPLIARGIILLLFSTSHYAQEKGMVREIIENLPREAAWIVVIFCSLIGLYFSFWGMMLTLAGFWLLRRLMYKTLNGFTGDTTGALVEISEVLFLIGAVLI